MHHRRCENRPSLFPQETEVKPNSRGPSECSPVEIHVTHKWVEWVEKMSYAEKNGHNE